MDYNDIAVFSCPFALTQPVSILNYYPARSARGAKSLIENKAGDPRGL